MSRIRCLVVLLGVTASPANGQFFYRFDDFDGEHIATLETNVTESGTHKNLVGLTFTEFGQDLFGLHALYGGTFDNSTGAFLEVDGELRALDAEMNLFAGFRDDDPPRSSLSALAGKDYRFVIGVSPTQDSIGFNVVPSGLAVGRQGHWTRVVPEPNASMPLFAGLVAAHWVGRQRRGGMWGEIGGHADGEKTGGRGENGGHTEDTQKTGDTRLLTCRGYHEDNKIVHRPARISEPAW